MKIIHSDRTMNYAIVLLGCLSTVSGAVVHDVVGPEDVLVGGVVSEAKENPLVSALPGVVLHAFLEDVGDAWQGPVDQTTTYIVGGHVAKPGAWPWQASLRYKGKHHCGGVVIGPRWVLTSAQCLQEIPELPTVMMGLYDQRVTKDLTEYIVANATIHHDYSSEPTPQHNLALLKLNVEVDFTGLSVSAVDLPNANQNFPRPSTCYITGWGRVSRFVDVNSDILQEAKIKVFENFRCRRAWRWFGKQIYPSNICVGRYLHSAACAGDEGGPLVCKVGGTWKLAGVSSWTTELCATVMPSVYTRVSEYRQWIAAVSGI